MSNYFGRLPQLLNHIEEWVMASLLAFMTLLTFTNVVLRYVFNTGVLWSLEATTYSFAALVLFGMAYGVRTRTHIAVDLVIRKLPEKVAYFAALFAILLCIIYSLVMFYGAAVFVDRLHTLGNLARDIPAPKWLLTSVMPIGFALLAFRFIEAGWLILKMGSAGYAARLNEKPEAVPVLMGDAESEQREEK